MSGRVYLVGAGPGDPGLLTARALEVIAAADVLLVDRLAPSLPGVRADALVIDVGKEGGGEQVPQERTNELLLEHARAGRTVARVKGGDPFVFGRGGEEALLLRDHGIPFEVVPGVTAGVAAPAYAGIPVTQRGVASAVAFVTGHEDPGKPQNAVDWVALARFPGTLVFYMGVRALSQIAEALIRAGRPPNEPAAVIERGTLPEQRTVTAPLAEIAAAADEAGIRPPSVTVVGAVAALAEDLAWLGRGPLGGVSVVVTRTPLQASELAERLATLGARVVNAPAIAIEPLDVTIPPLDDFDLLVLTSPNGVWLFFEALRASGRDARALSGCRVAVVGPGTASALRERGIEADVVPTRAVGEGLAEALADVPVRRALVARAETARDVVPEALRGAGAEVELLALYRTIPAPLDARTCEAALTADWATFASGSAARALVAAAGGADALRAARVRLASIGPQTSAALRELGLEPDLEAAEHSPDGLVQALVDEMKQTR